MSILDWLRDKMYTTGGYDPVLASIVNPDGSTDQDPSLDPEALTKIKTTTPTAFGRIVKGMPGILASGIAAAATPNIAYGGPTDIFRAMQAGGNATQDRDLLNYKLSRQGTEDALAREKSALDEQDLLRKWANDDAEANHRRALEQAASRRADMDETNKQATEIGSFTGTGHGGEFQPLQTDLPIAPLTVPGIQPAPDSGAPSALDLPMNVPDRQSLDVPTPVPEGYQVEPSIKYDIPGTRRVAPTAATLLAQRKTAEQANWPKIRNQDQADFFGLDIGTPVAPAEYAAYSAQHRQDTRPTPPPKTPANIIEWEAIANDPTETPERKTQARAILADELKRVQAGRAQTSSSASSPTDAKDIAEGIMRGDLPPEMSRLYGKAAAVEAELGRSGYPLAVAQNDYKAVQRHLSTLNGQQQERLRQAITFTNDSLPLVEQLYDHWKQVGSTSGIRLFNKASLTAAANLPGEAGSAATNLLAQINDLTSELGTVYKGGNSSTDEGLRLAATNLSGDWNEQTFKDAIKRLKQNLTIRKNSILTSEPAGVSANSPYIPQSSQPQGSGRGGDPLGIR